GKGRDVFAVGVVDPDGNDVVAGAVKQRRDVKAEGGEVALVRPCSLAVDVNVGDGGGGVELEKEALAGGAGDAGCKIQVPAVPPGAAIVVVSPIFAVLRVPGVR